MLGRRASQAGILRAAGSRRICARISRLSAFRRAGTIWLYFPVRGEVDVLPLFRSALRAGKQAAFPRVEGGRIVFYAVKSLSSLVPGKFGIPAPVAGASRPVSSPDLVIAPGTAFSIGGARLGYGGGYYDRALRGSRATVLGAAFGFQVVAGLPQSPRDAAVDAVVTEDRVYFSKSRT
jgi:5-formyltetrahydrofolate cyclo-ligase